MKIFFLLIICISFTLISCDSTTTEKKENQGIKKVEYQEQHRPQFHFSPPQQWMNDPNGMVYYDGEYHLFYQHYPDSNVWGPMHWGHAVSTDLMTWENLPIALYPDSLGYIFSGSAVIDWNNTSGFQTGNEPPMIAIYTYHLMEGEQAGRKDFQTQGIAYSNDKGRTWTTYAGNPVIPNTENIKDFRDPKVFWHEASSKWVMIFAIGDRVRIYNSANLKKWEVVSEFGLGLGSEGKPWECPDLFELPIEGTTESKWVMLVSLGKGGANGGSATQYFVGDFDGKTFTLEESMRSFYTPIDGKAQTLWADYGRDNYAGVTWADIPKDDGRRIFLGWMSNWQYAREVPTYDWRSTMTLPRTLHLIKTDNEIRLKTKPVKETAILRTGKSHKVPATTLAEDLELSKNINGSLMEIVLEAKASEDSNFGIQLSNEKGEIYKIGFDAQKNQYYSDRTKSGKVDFSADFAKAVHAAPRIAKEETIKLRLFFDVASAELFADDGLTVLTDIYFPNEDFSKIHLFVEKGDVELVDMEIFELKSVW